MTEQTPQERKTQAVLTRLLQQMERRWHELTVAEQSSQPVQVLEQLYDAYLDTLEAYMRRQRGERRERRETASLAGNSWSGSLFK